MGDYKVALISHEFPPFLIGGMASHCYDLAYSLSKNKVFTTVFCGMSKRVTVEKLNPYLEVVRLPCLDLPPRFLWFQIQNFRILSQFLKDFDILHGVNPLASAICSYFKKKLRKPFVTSIHEVLLSDLKVFINSPFSEWTLGDFKIHAVAYPLDEFLVKTCLKSADHVVVCGNSAFRDMKRIYPNLAHEKTSVIYNGINFDELDKIVNPASERDFSIVYYGRLVWIKGILYLVRAMALLKDDFPNLSLNIIGKGPLEGKIRHWVRRLGLKEKVHIRGYFPRAKLIREIGKSSVVVLPSLYEVGPFISGLEAMACKKPLVTFDFPFTREFILSMRNGVLAKAKDVEDLANKIRLVLSDTKLQGRLGQNAYEYVKSKHNWDLLVEKYLEIYDNLLRSNHS